MQPNLFRIMTYLTKIKKDFTIAFFIPISFIVSLTGTVEALRQSLTQFYMVTLYSFIFFYFIFEIFDINLIQFTK